MTEPSNDSINVVISMDFDDETIEQLRAISPRLNIRRYHPEVPASAWADVEVLYTGSTFPRPEDVPHLRWIQMHSAGIDKALNQRIMQAEDVIVTTASGIHTRQMANIAMMMVLTFHYRLLDMIEDKREVKWRQDAYKFYRPDDLTGQTIGIAGYGSIGREIARIAHTFGMTVLASKRNIKQPVETGHDYTPAGTGDPEGDIPERLYPGEAIASMAARSDYLVLTTPLTPATKHMVNAQVLNGMKPNAVLINLGRGGTVDEKALITALSSGKIRGAGLDVFEEEPLPETSPLWNMDNVIISPHVSGNSARYNEKAATLFGENLRRYLDKRPLMNQLNRDEGY